jgi:acyl-CoA ligase (AMP-forming) (exosortase A-associated)
MFSFTVYDLLAKNLSNNADHPAIILADTVIDYGQLVQLVDNTATWLKKQGVQRGDRIGIHLPKSIEEIVATFAIARVGAVFVNINYQWTLHQLEYIIDDCGIRLLFTDHYRFQKIKSSPLFDRLKHVLVKGNVESGTKVTQWSDVPVATYTSEEKPIDVDLAALLYTSGSTGKPKGVMLTHAHIVQGARSVACYLKNTSSDRVLGLLPMSFDYGMNQLTTMFLVGGTIVLQPVMMPTEIVKTINSKSITGVAAVPPAWIQIIRYLEEVKVELPSLRYITNSGGKIPPNILNLMMHVFRGTDIYLMYGLTEAFRSSYLPPALFHQKMGAIGKAIPNAELYVVHPEKGLCQSGEEGELVHRGSLISLGYWNNPQATEDKIKVCEHLRPLLGEEKVLFSGDLVRLDEEGILWFLGRMDSMIKSSGFRISPTEVEDITYKSNLVEDAIAFGVEDELLGQVVHITVSTTHGETVDIAELTQYFRENMPHYMVPVKVHFWQGQMPRNSSGKLDRPFVISTCMQS